MNPTVPFYEALKRMVSCGEVFTRLGNINIRYRFNSKLNKLETEGAFGTWVSSEFTFAELNAVQWVRYQVPQSVSFTMKIKNGMSEFDLDQLSLIKLSGKTWACTAIEVIE